MSKIFGRVKNFGSLLKDTYLEWNEREPFNNSIIIAYYTIFSLPGLLVIVINLAGYFFGAEAVTKQLSSQIGGVVGGNTAEDIQAMIANASGSKGTVLSNILGVATLIFGATGVFYQLQQILNKMWEVKAQPKKKMLKLVRDRVFSFGLILVIGFLLLVSLALSAALAAMSDWVGNHLSESLVAVFGVLDIVVSIAVITLLFAAIFKFLPDAKIRWKDVWIGALLTAVLFVIAKFLLGLYFGKSDPGSTYGAAGSIILIMLWVNYAGLILLFGAEFTKVYADRYGVKVVPTEGAVSTHGQNENGAIVNKKTEAATKAKRESTPVPGREDSINRQDQPRKKYHRRRKFTRPKGDGSSPQNNTGVTAPNQRRNSNQANSPVDRYAPNPERNAQRKNERPNQGKPASENNVDKKID
jgi:membrane protein